MDDRTEQLVTRRLDGEITEEESLELDKRLIRSPEARAYLEEQCRIDALAGAVLHEVCSPSKADACSPAEAESPLWQPQTRGRGRYLRPIAAAAAAIAVALLVILLPSGRSDPAGATPLAARNNQDETAEAKQPVITVPVDNSWSGLPRAGRHEVLGVYDEATQSLYLLEMSPRSDANSLTAADF
jgi:anti-sigma factor RsiW